MHLYSIHHKCNVMILMRRTGRYIYNKRLNNMLHLGYLLTVYRNQYIISSLFHGSYAFAWYPCIVHLHTIMCTIILVLVGTLIGVNANGDASINTITQDVIRSKLARFNLWSVCRRLKLLLYNIIRRRRSTNLCFSLIFKPIVEMEENY